MSQSRGWKTSLQVHLSWQYLLYLTSHLLKGLELFYTHKHSSVRSDIKIKMQLCKHKQHLIRESKADGVVVSSSTIYKGKDSLNRERLT